jgi:hypothetical protein
MNALDREIGPPEKMTQLIRGFQLHSCGQTLWTEQVIHVKSAPDLT